MLRGTYWILPLALLALSHGVIGYQVAQQRQSALIVADGPAPAPPPIPTAVAVSGQAADFNRA